MTDQWTMWILGGVLTVVVLVVGSLWRAQRSTERQLHEGLTQISDKLSSTREQMGDKLSDTLTQISADIATNRERTSVLEVRVQDLPTKGEMSEMLTTQLDDVFERLQHEREKSDISRQQLAALSVSGDHRARDLDRVAASMDKLTSEHATISSRLDRIEQRMGS